MQNSNEKNRDGEDESIDQTYQNSNLNQTPNNHDITNPDDPSGTNPKRYDSFDAQENVSDSGNRTPNKTNQQDQHAYSNEDDRQLGKRERLNDESDDSEDETESEKNDREKFFEGGL